MTEIETWLRDPYAIYAKHILRLRKLDDLDQETEAADYGTLVHAGLHFFLREHGVVWPDDSDALMRRAMHRALAESFARPALAAWWEPRLDRIAAWVVETERIRRDATRLTALETEVLGSWEIQRPTRLFTLRARADRIERRADGLLAILDYKTGLVPKRKELDLGLAPQLLLEAAMAADGAFGPALRATTAELTYWHLAGGYEPGEATKLYDKNGDDLQAEIAKASRGLKKLIDQFDEPDRCYLARPYPAWTPRFSDYTQLERVAEWSLTADEDEA